MEVKDSMTVYDNVKEQITDIEDYILQDKVKLVPLHKGQKEPYGKNWNTKKYSLEYIKNYDGNLGILPGYNHTDTSLAIIDIDGYSRNSTDKEYKAETQEAIYNCLKEIPGAMIVRSQSGGKHIYLWNRTPHKQNHEVSKRLHFPDDFGIPELRGKSLFHSIEIFSNDAKRQCLLPGCVIINKATNEKKHYTRISQIDKLSDIGVVDDIWETVKNKMIEHGYSYHETNPEETTPQEYEEKQVLKSLTNKECEEVAITTADILKEVDGAKHTASLMLGGYFSRHITKKSAKKICDKVIPHIHFDNNSAFIHTVLQNYDKADEHLGGLPTLKKMLLSATNDLDKTDGLLFRIKRVCDANFKHDILFKKYSNYRKKYLRIDYNNNSISFYTWEKYYNKKTETYEIRYTDVYDVLNISPVKIYESFNILEKQASPKLCFTFYSRGMPYQQTIEGTDVENVEKQLSKRPGVVLKPKEYKGLINEIIKEYVRLDLIHIVEDIAVPGVFINPITNTLARADKNGAVEITKPSKEKVKEGLEIWNKLHTVYPGDKTKLSHIIRYGLICPFSYILKIKYEWLPLLFLYGASQTAKTTLAEISLCPYVEINDDVSIGGASVNTEYRLGNALSRQGYGDVINEPGQMISRLEMQELIKRAIESGYCREKQENGIHTKIPAYSNMIFTSNSYIPTQDAFIRRSEFVEFTSSERMNDADKRRFNRTFNHVNWNNTDFLRLRSVGDYIIWYASEHLDLLSRERKEIVDTFIQSAYDYCGMIAPEWLFQDTELMDISSSDNEILDDFRGLVLKDYRHLVGNSSIVMKLAETTPEVHIGESLDGIIEEIDVEYERFKNIFRALLKNHYVDYLHYQYVHGVEYVIVNTSVRRAMGNVTVNQITCKGLADYMNCDYKNISYTGETIKGFRMVLDDFLNFLSTGVIK